MPLSDLQYIPGVGPKKAELLEKECNLHTIEELLGYYPYRYVDKSKVYRICDVPAMNPSPGSGTTLPFILLRGHFTLFTEEGSAFHRWYGCHRMHLVQWHQIHPVERAEG